MIPFLKAKQSSQPGIMTQIRNPDETKSPEDTDGLDLAMKDYCDAYEAKDFKGMAKAFRAAFQILDAEPHDEYDHSEE